MRRYSRSASLAAYPDRDVEKFRMDYENKHSEQPKRTRRNLAVDYLIEYSANSNLHGLKYIGEKERPLAEKVFWVVAIIVSIGLCANVIKNLWTKWDQTPVIVTFAETVTPVWKIPFPAVTVCPQTKAKASKYNFTKGFHAYSAENLTEEEMHQHEDITMVCDPHLAPANGRLFASGPEILDHLKQVTPNLTHTVFGCKWQGISTGNCSQLFSPILTEEGICFTFNTLGAQELLRTDNLQTDYPYLEFERETDSWKPDEGYSPNASLGTYPHRGFVLPKYGEQYGLILLLNSYEYDFDNLCKGPQHGFKVFLHNPAVFPQPSKPYLWISSDQQAVLTVKPSMMTTSEGLRSYKAERRQCYFQNERYLKYFKVYTQANCEMECMTNFTYTRCGCVHFGIPYSQGMTVCSAAKIDCLTKSQTTVFFIFVNGPGCGSGITGVIFGVIVVELASIEMGAELDGYIEDNETENMIEAREVSRLCKCLPACTSLEYEAEISQSYFDWKNLFSAWQINVSDPDFEGMIVARVVVLFKEAKFINLKRAELYGQIDFVANCGGLLGLFMGFSILSLVEIFYFTTLRLGCMFWRKRNKNTTKSPRESNRKRRSKLKLKKQAFD